MSELAFSDQLLLMVLDKVVIGLLFAAGAYLLDRRLEWHKAQQALAVELAKERIRAIAEAWYAMADYETRATVLVVAAQKLREECGDDRNKFAAEARRVIEPKEAELHARYGDLLQLIHSRQLWAPRGWDKELFEYLKCVRDYLVATLRGEPAAHFARDLEVRRASAGERMRVSWLALGFV